MNEEYLISSDGGDNHMLIAMDAIAYLMAICKEDYAT